MSPRAPHRHPDGEPVGPPVQLPPRSSPRSATAQGAPATGSAAATRLPAEALALDRERAALVFAAPRGLRQTFAAALVFNAQLARACEEAGEDMVALVRLAFWREAMERALEGGDAGRPEVAALFAGPGGRRTAAAFAPAIAAREGFVEARGFPDVAAYRAFAEATSGALHALLAQLAGRPAEVVEAARAAGTAYGVAGLLRSSRAYARRGAVLVPQELVPPRRVLARAGGVAVPEVARAVRRLLEALPQPEIAPHLARDPLVAVPLRLAVRSRRQLERTGFDPFAPRVGPLPFALLDLLPRLLRRPVR